MNSTTLQQSFVYQGRVQHRRFSQKSHQFSYRLYMMALDLDEIDTQFPKLRLFGRQWFKPIRFVESDYIAGDPLPLRQRIFNKLNELGAEDVKRVVMLVQCRCFGLYFSPANFFFCYGENGACKYMLAEVSNTPWNRRHYYLVNLTDTEPTEKSFHVSPFMDLDMQYHWRIKPPMADSESLSIHIENRRHDGEKLFDATLSLKQESLTDESLRKVWLRQPMMTLTIVKGIYLQAMKLFMKRIRFVPYQHKSNDPVTKH